VITEVKRALSKIVKKFFSMDVQFETYLECIDEEMNYSYYGALFDIYREGKSIGVAELWVNVFEDRFGSTELIEEIVSALKKGEIRI